MRTIHRYSRFLAPLGEIWGCVLYMGAYSTWGKNGISFLHQQVLNGVVLNYINFFSQNGVIVRVRLI